MVTKHDATLLAASREGTGRGQHLRTSHVKVFVSEQPRGGCVLGAHTAGSTELNFGTRMTGAFKSAVDQYEAQ
jgi:hypothetical protein